MPRFIVLLASLFLLALPVAADTPWSTDVQPWLEQVMPQADSFSEKAGDPPVIRGYKINSETGEQELVGYLFLSADVPPEEKGYSAPIDMLIGLHVDGHLTGIKVLHYVESYRYSRGDFLSTEGFQQQFQDKPITDNFRVRHDIDGVSNATISSWAIARTVRSASRKVAKAYMGFSEGNQQQKTWNANALEQLQQLSWQDLIDRGMVVQGQVPTPVDTELQLSIAYMGRAALGEFFVGAEDYEKAERDSSIRFDTPEMIAVAVGGSGSHLFRQERLSFQQGDSPARRVHPRRIVNAGNAKGGIVAGHAEYTAAIVMEEDFDPTQPFTVSYQALGMDEPLELSYQVSGIPLQLAQGEPILSLEEIEEARLAEAGILTRLREAPPWGQTDWPKVLMLLVTLALVTTAFLRKSSRVRWVALTATLFYLGFYDGGFLSVSHITGVLMQGPGILLNNLTVLLIVGFTVLTTLLWGRVFCSSLCPFGALQDFITRFTPRHWQLKVPQGIHDRALYIKYGFLAFIVGMALLQSNISVFQYFEPFGTLFFFSSSLLLWSILLLILAGSVLIPRFYCRYACPLGAALGLVSLISPLRIKRVPQCDLCKVCERACPTGAIRGPKIDFKECVRCDICEIKLIERAGSCRHSAAEIARRQQKVLNKQTDVQAVRIIDPVA
ncbi:4Fe-4S binding protein [Proteobacteria bacterium 005FR1]|nr:4Fe-4S binding protein [Proteobacteria bacterium 005FR1]